MSIFPAGGVGNFSLGHKEANVRKVWNWIRSLFVRVSAVDPAPVVVFYKCGNCGAFLQAGQAFCEVCGLDLSKTTFEGCGAPVRFLKETGDWELCQNWIEPHHTFCTKCGRNLSIYGRVDLPTKIVTTAS